MMTKLDKIKKGFYAPKVVKSWDVNNLTSTLHEKRWKELTEPQKKNILFLLGLDVIHHKYQTVMEELDGKKVLLFVCQERIDDVWLSSGRASREAHEHMTHCSSVYYETLNEIRQEVYNGGE